LIFWKEPLGKENPLYREKAREFDEESRRAREPESQRAREQLLRNK